MGTVVYMKETNSYKLTQDNEELFELLTRGGYSFTEAKELIKEVIDGQGSYEEIVKDVEIRKDIDLSLVATKVDIDKLTSKQIEQLFWNLGLNTQTKAYGKFKKILIKPGNKVEAIDIMIGAERLDKGWLNKRDEDGKPYASEEARYYHRNMTDPGWREDVAKLSRTTSGIMG